MPGSVWPDFPDPVLVRRPFVIGPRGLILLLAVVSSVGPAVPRTAAQQRSAYEELQTFSGVLNHVRLNYVDSVSYGELVAAAIRGALRALDPHSYYVSRADWERRDAVERGELAAPGVVLEDVEGVPTVLAIVPRSPAAKAGIAPGDRVVAVNDTAVAGLDATTLESRLAGEKGSKVRLRVERGPRLEPDSFSVTLKRTSIEQRSVSTVRMVDPVTAYVRLEEFGPRAADEVRDALKQLRGRGARQAIIDLRGNPGGIVTSAVQVAAEFFPKGTVVFRTQSRKKDVDTTFVTKRDGDFVQLPLVALIDEGSASASEALAGSLQDHDRALLVGRRSFGKALVQTMFLLPHGDVVWLTIGRVLTPNGRFIQRRYRGLGYEQYLSFAGKAGAAEDTLAAFKTDHGRDVRGGGGIRPDVEVPLAARLPAWWSAAADSGLDDAVADSVAFTLPPTPAGRAAWNDAAGDWRVKLVTPFLSRVRSRLGVDARADSALEARLGRILAARAAEVRWGPDAREEFLARNDAAVRTALAHFPRLPELLRTGRRAER